MSPGAKTCSRACKRIMAETWHFAAAFAVAEGLIRNPSDNVAEYNRAAIEALGSTMGIDVGKMVRSSELNVSSQATDMLIDLVRAHWAAPATCAAAARVATWNPKKFAEAGLDLVYRLHAHPVYAQLGGSEFVPGLSCLDALFHCGAATVAGWFDRSTPAARRAWSGRPHGRCHPRFDLGKRAYERSPVRAMNGLLYTSLKYRRFSRQLLALLGRIPAGRRAWPD